jgi:hypothetical protein
LPDRFETIRIKKPDATGDDFIGLQKSGVDGFGEPGWRYVQSPAKG